MVRRQVAALARRVEDDGDEHALRELAELAAVVEDTLAASARSLAVRQSWSFVGNELGLTRQGARQKFDTRRPGPRPAAD